MKRSLAAWSPVTDLEGVQMVDRRHARRVVAIAKRAVSAPRVSFPRMMRDDGELEGAYRLFSNPNVSSRAILDAHFAATAGRVREAAMPTIVVHDTSDCCFGGESKRAGIGKINNDGKGIAIHVALAIAPDGSPFGLLDLTSHTRLKKVNSNRTYAKRPPDKKESWRWAKGVEQAGAKVGPGHELVHVMDREGDNYVLFDALCRQGRSFVIRLAQNRRILDDSDELLFDAVEEIEAKLERDVPLSRRTDHYRRLSAKKNHPARTARMATLSIGARPVTLRRGSKAHGFVENPQLRLNVVRVWEENSADGEPPVEWLLLTDLPISTAAQLERIVDIYRLRWTVEEFFKALKTGCSFEQRQLESRHALENALAILAPIACQLLLLRSLARSKEKAAATEVLTPTQIDVLRALSVRFDVPKRPTVRDALRAVAGLGGFLARNGEPGWQTLGLGLERLLEAETVWNAAKGQRRCDQ